MILHDIATPVVTTSVSSEFTIGDGEEIVAGGYPLPRTWESASAAAEAMESLCWHPGRFAGPFRVIPVVVQRTEHGTVLAVTP